MNIYRKDNEILVSKNGKPDGWEFLGSDESLNDTTRKSSLSLDQTKAQNLLNAMRAFVKPIKLNRYSKEALVYSKTTVAEIAGVVA